MPELSRFHGITIHVYVRDHGPPHFHAKSGGGDIAVSIRDLRVLNGSVSPRIRRLVLRWASMHQAELMDAWNTTRREGHYGRIDPLP